VTHSVHSCLCVDCLDYRDRVKAAKRRRGLRDLSLFSPVAANRDAAAGAETPSVRVTRDTRTEGSNSEPAAAGLGQMSSVGGETRSEHAAPVVLTVGGSTLDSLPLVVHEAPGVSGPAVHVVMSLPVQ